ncbi:MAG: hypothetical protein ACLQGT_01215 [Terracidiphilus sp.]
MGGFPDRVDPSSYLNQGTPGPALRAANPNDKSIGQLDADSQREQAEALVEAGKYGLEKGLEHMRDRAYEIAKEAAFKAIGPLVAAGALTAIKTGVRVLEFGGGVALGVMDSTETAGPSLDERPSANDRFSTSVGSERALP